MNTRRAHIATSLLPGAKPGDLLDYRGWWRVTDVGRWVTLDAIPEPDDETKKTCRTLTR